MTTSSTPCQPRPSQCTEEYWIHAKNQTTENNTSPGEHCGKWLIFTPPEQVDADWEKVREATENGLLGFASKVATAKDNPIAGGRRMKVICVYTYDWTDEADVMRVREALRKIGYTNKLCYKADEDTYAGKYAHTGHKRISKYYA